MGSAHLSPEVLSALADGELTAAEQGPADAHLSECVTCRSSLAGYQAFDREVRLPPAVGCEAVLPLLSARIDTEVSAAEFAVTARHLEACEACRAMVAGWRALPALIGALPAGTPSPRVDRAIAELSRHDTRRAARPALVARGLIAAGATVAILVAGLARTSAPIATPAAQDARVLVAAAQQFVLSPRTNTLYVLDTAAAAVDARDASTNGLKVRIEVGGRPTALALNESANTLLVLDSSQKKLTEIDTTSNRVIGSSTVAVAGTPTAISVDRSGGKILVTADADATASGSLSVIDGTTKKVETVRDFAAAPQAMVFSPSGDRAAVVSADATTVLDQSYKPIATLPGGVGAAFAQGDDRLAILSPAADGSVITYSGRGAPAALHLEGTPRAITSLPDGGFLVLVDVGDRSRVSHVAPDGHVVGSVDLAAKGRGLAYDAASRRFSVASAGQVVSMDVPQTMIAAASPSPTPGSATSTPAPAASPSPSASPAPSASASPSASPSAVAAASATPKPLDLAPTIAQNFVHLDLPGGRAPFAVSQSGERLWVLDDRNGVDAVELSSGEVLPFVTLPKSASISHFVAGRASVYALDARHGDLYAMSVPDGKTTRYELKFLKPVSSMAVGLDDRLWIGLRDAPYLLRFDPRTKRTDSFDLAGAQVSTLATDGLGTVYYADDVNGTVGAVDPDTGRITEVGLPRRGVTTGLAVDGAGRIWVGTSAGEIWAVLGGSARLTVGLPRPITTLSLDASGHVWYLAPLPSGALGFGYAAADGAHAGQTVGGPAFGLSFSALGQAWLADPRGGFWVSKAHKQ